MADAVDRPYEPTPEIRQVLEDLKRIGNPLDRLTRENVAGFWYLRETLARQAVRKIGVGQVRDVVVAARNHVIPVRIYTPNDATLLRQGRRPVTIFFHGGGWALGSLAAYDSLCRVLAEWVGAIVVSVDYRLAPEHPYPAGVEDAYLALEWVARNAEEFGGDETRLATAGDSGGGTLATVMALDGRKAGISIVFQALFYPCVQVVRTDYPSYRQYADGYWLTRKSVETFREFYLPEREDWEHPHVSPLLMRDEDLKSMPPALVMTCGCDVLRDEGQAYAERLRANGVKVTQQFEPHMIHACLNLFNARAYPEASARVEEVIRTAAATIRDGLG